MATTSSSGTLTKIYDLQTLGYDEVKGQFKSLTQELERLKKVKQELSNMRTRIDDPAALQQAEQAIRKTNAAYDSTKMKLETINRERQQHINVLAAEANSLTLLGTTTEKTAANSLSAYQQLNKQYREARDNAAAMAKQFGIDSEEARAAAASAAEYKQQLTEINTLIKNGGRPAVQAPAIVSTDNLAELRAEQQRATSGGGGAVVTDLEREQAAVSNASAATSRYGAVQREAAAAVAELQQDIERIQTPFENYTGTLTANIKQQESYKNRLAQIGAELKNLNATTDAADKRSANYKNRVAALVEEQKMLKISSSDLGQTINAQVKYVQAADGSQDQLNAKLGLARNLMRGLSEEEKASPFGKQLASDITTLDGNLKKADASMGNYQRNVGNYSSAFGKAFGVLRQAANILPGIGLAGIFGLMFTGLEKIGTFLIDLATKTSKAREQMELYKTAVSDISKEAVKNTAGDVSKLELLRRVITDATKSQEARNAALREYNSMADKANQIDKSEIDNLNLINNRIAAQIDLIEKRGLARAAESIIAQRSEKLLLAQEAAGGKARDGLGEASGGAFNVATPAAAPQYKVGDEILMWDPATKKMKKVVVTKDVLDQQNIAAQQAASTRQGSNREKLIQQLVAKDPAVAAAQKELDAALSAFKDKVASVFEDPQNTSAKAGSQLVKNALNDIEANLRRELAAEETRVAVIKKDRELTYAEEVAYVQNIEGINTKYLNQKIVFMQQQKKLSAEERATLAGFVKDRADAQLAAATKEAEIRKRFYKDAETDLRGGLDEQLRGIKEHEQAVLDDVNASEQQKARARIDANNYTQQAEEQFQQKLLQLQQKYGQDDIAANQDIANKIAQVQKESVALQRAYVQSIFTDYEKAIDKQVAAIKLKYDSLKSKVLSSDLPKGQKDAQIVRLEKSESIEIAARQLKTLTEELKTAKSLYDAGLITLEQYEAVYGRVVKAQGELTKGIDAAKEKYTSLGDFLSKKLNKLFSFKEGSVESGLSMKLMTDAYSLATDAMHDYFNAERERIQQSLALQEERLDAEKRQVLARSQSTAQTEPIEKEYAGKKRKAEHDAGEQLKKSKKAEAKINLASELAGIAVAAAMNPANGVTFGAAGAIMYALMAGVAFGRYALRVNEINREQFAFGGQPGAGDVPVDGGVFGGRPHSDGGTPFLYRGRTYEAEVGELSVIRTKNAPANRTYSITGTHTQIASQLNELGGGRRFAPGARLSRFDYGGNLGETLQPPVFRPALQTAVLAQSGGVTREDLYTVLARFEAVAEAQSNRIDKIQVVQVTSSVTDAQKKHVYQSETGRL